MKTLIIDIETKPNADLVELFNNKIKPDSRLKDPVKIEASIEKQKAESVKKMSVDTDFSTVFCVGVHDLEENKSEVLKFEEFIKKLNEIAKTGLYKIVTFNGQDFDLPILLKQCIKNKLEVPAGLKDCQKRYSDKHIDLMKLIGVYGKYKSLDMYLQIYLGIAKKEIDFETCTDQELKDHCLEDIENTAKLYKLFREIC